LSLVIAVRRLTEEHCDFLFNIKQIDTVAASFPAYTNYLYSTYNAVGFPTREVIVVGTGVYGIDDTMSNDTYPVTD
jgi:carbamoyl-phosphate synthase/aspartate carbamoyltransferase